MSSMEELRIDGGKAEAAEVPGNNAGVSEGRAKRILERRAEKVSTRDLSELTDKLKAKVRDLKNLEEGLHWIGTLIGRAKLLYGMIRDRDFQIELKTKLLVAAGLIYFVLPTDLTPDFIPGIGYVDDAVVLATLWKLVSEELGRYILFLKESGRGDDELDVLAFGTDAPSNT